MSGHSKWSKVKHQKESQDAVKGKIFTKLANFITMAVRECGGVKDPVSNFRLRLAIEKARNYNMPKEKIEKAIERGTGRLAQGASYNEAVYEAFGPGGVGIIIETATDNKQRTVARLKSALDMGGGNLATAGSVMHYFKQVGLIRTEKKGKSVDEIMSLAIDEGALDFEDSGDAVEIYTKPDQLHKVKECLSANRINVLSFEPFYLPATTIPIDSKEISQQLIKLLHNLEDLEDVKSVYANFEIPDEHLDGQTV